MKYIKTALTFLFITITFICTAQWSGSPGDISYTTGKVGIGISSPLRQFHVRGDDDIMVLEDVAAYNQSPAPSMNFRIQYNTGGSIADVARIQGFKENATSGNWDGGLAFYSRKNGSSLAEAMRINSSGNVGIGTTSPNELLSIESSSANQLGLVNVSGNSWQFRAGSSGSLIFRDDGVERVRIDGAGNVGIGTTSPAYKLTVNTADENHVRVENGSELAFLRLNDDGNFNIWAHGDDDLIFTRGYGSGTESMRINSSGNIGIGTASPSFKLSVGAGAGDISSAIQINTDDSDKILLSRYGTNGSKISMSSGWTTDYKAGQGLTTQSGNHRFFTSATNGYIERLIINSVGNVGIGTSSPDDKLDVEGDLRVTNGHIRVFTSTGTAGFINGLGNAKMSLGTENGSTLVIDRGSESVGIGTSTIPSDYKLAVDGKIISEEVKVELSGSWPDYVFEPNYNLPTLESLEEFIKSKKHLPEIPSAEEMEENGVELGNMNMLLLKKIEELTLYVIELKKENESQQKEIDELKVEK